MDQASKIEEAHRLAALHGLDILDTEAEQAFDDLTALAAEICGTPISAVSLVDHSRQWFKSEIGLGVSETPRDVAFCHHAIQTPDEVLIVEDAAEDDRFRENALVTGDPGIRFYAGAPMRISGGHTVGTLCVIDNKPRALTTAQINSLRILSRQAVANIELRKTNQRLAARNNELGQFAYRVAHDVRSPLNTSKLLAECIVEDIDLGEYEEASANVGKIIGQMDKLNTLTSELLDLTKADLADLKNETIDFEQILRETLHSQTKLIESGEISVIENVRAAFPLVAPRVRIEQVLQNLLSNAFKYHDPKRSHRFVEVSWTEHPKGAELQVTDNGLGIPTFAQEKIFQLFQRFHPGHANGTGLGLAIVKKHIDALNGTITLNSSNAGSQFKIWLPQSSATQASP